MTIDNTVWLDIETVPLWSSEEEALSSNPDLYDVFKRRYCKDKPEDLTDRERFRERSALFPEFGRIVCISIWREEADIIHDSIWFRTKSFCDDNEVELLTWFRDLLNSEKLQSWKLWWHNIKWFDLSYIIKRMMIHWIKIPPQFNIIGKKPREVQHIDTQELRQFGRSVSTSLELLCVSLKIPTPKDDISWSEVKDIFYWPRLCPPPNHPHLTPELDRIATYCEKDVVASYEVYKYIMNYL